MEKIVEQTLLYDFYGELLTEHQREIYDCYISENLSFNEIAQMQDISRQAAFDLIKRIEKLLLSYEEKLHLVERFLDIKEKVANIRNLTDNKAVSDLCNEILEDL